jgi:hypothetical protein
MGLKHINFTQQNNNNNNNNNNVLSSNVIYYVYFTTDKATSTLSYTCNLISILHKEFAKF